MHEQEFTDYVTRATNGLFHASALMGDPTEGMIKALAGLLSLGSEQSPLGAAEAPGQVAKLFDLAMTSYASDKQSVTTIWKHAVECSSGVQPFDAPSWLLYLSIVAGEPSPEVAAHALVWAAAARITALSEYNIRFMDVFDDHYDSFLLNHEARREVSEQLYRGRAVREYILGALPF